MDSAEWGILLLFLGILFFVIIGFITYISKSDSPSGKVDTPTTPHKTSPKPFEPELPKKEEQTYVSIYEYTSVKTVKRCAYCDGENKNGAKVCCICGNDIDS